MKLAILLLAFALQQKEQPGLIEGTVNANGEPRPGISVSVGKLQTKTNAAGKYSFRDVPSGRQTIRVGEPFRSIAIPESRTLTVAAGQTVTADFAMTLQSSVSGVVVDEFDEPVSPAEVVLLGSEYGAGAPRYFRRHVTSTNDQGAYRFEYVRPDTPYILLVLPPVNRRATAKSAAPTDPRLRRPASAPTFFPSVKDYAGATPLILRPGEDRESINVRMLRAPSYCIEAQVGGTNTNFQIHGAHLPFGMGPNGGTTSMPLTLKPGPDGKVRVCELPPGDYRVTAFEGNLNETLSVAFATVSLLDRDATNVALQPLPNFTVPVELTWAGEPPAVSPEAKLRVMLISMTRSFGQTPYTPDPATPPATLALKDTSLDDYYLRVMGLTGRLYSKEILYGVDNITYAPFRPGTKHDGAGLRVVIGHDGSLIKARIRDRNGKPVPHATVVAMPAVFASEFHLASALQTGIADQYGAYESTRALPPGKYYLLALARPLPEPLQTHQVNELIGLRNQAREVDLQPGGTAEVELESR